MRPRAILLACRAARGTPHYVALRALLHDAALERRFRKHVEALRVGQSGRLTSAARDRDQMLGEPGR